MSNPDPFQSIDSQALADVTGGAAAIASGGSATSTDDQMLQMMTQLESSIQSMSSNSSGMDPSTLM
ncbi:MAG TPA: hypothetical protein VGG28_12235, partial [Kofleriaceae bacterium]